MSTLGVIYKSLSGLFGFTKGLDNLSSNVANVNTPGYKGKNVFFSELENGDGRGGGGVTVSSGNTRFAQGDLRGTGNNTDLAVDGVGFFVLKENDEYVYTRDGQFIFNNAGQLVDSDGIRRVMAIDGKGNLAPINLADIGISPPQATTRIELLGNLSPTATTGSKVPNTPAQAPLNLTLFDRNGESENLRIQFERIATPSGTTQVNFWQVNATAPTNSTVNLVGENRIAFNADGSIAGGFDHITLNYVFANGLTANVTVSFGSVNGFDGIVSNSSLASAVGVNKNDGRSLGQASASDIRINSEGIVSVAFTNGETRQMAQIALAAFNNLGTLVSRGSNVFAAGPHSKVSYGKAGEGIFGRIAAEQLEGSNVELSQEFADIIILQRGYQASSQVLNVTNQVIEELYNSVRGR